MYDRTLRESEIDGGPLDLPGVFIKKLRRDGGGGIIGLTKIRPGVEFPAQLHAEVDESVYVLDGDFVEDGVSHPTGTVFFAFARTPHGPQTTVGGCTVMTYFSAILNSELTP